MLTNRNSFLVRFIMLLLLSAMAATLLLIDRFSTRQILYDHRVAVMLSYPGFDEETTGV